MEATASRCASFRRRRARAEEVILSRTKLRFVAGALDKARRDLERFRAAMSFTSLRREAATERRSGSLPMRDGVRAEALARAINLCQPNDRCGHACRSNDHGRRKRADANSRNRMDAHTRMDARTRKPER